MEKKTKLEDVIPEQTLKEILHFYNKLRSIEGLVMSDFIKVAQELSKIKEGLQKIVDMGWLPEEFVTEITPVIFQTTWKTKNFDFNLHCWFKAGLENKKTHFDFENRTIAQSRKTKGQPKSHAKAFLISTLAIEVKERTGKANYGLIAQFLKPYYNIDEQRLAIEVKRILESQEMLHIIYSTIEYMKIYEPSEVLPTPPFPDLLQ